MALTKVTGAGVEGLSLLSSSTAISIDNIIILLEAGEELKITATAQAIAKGSARQIADLAKNLINP